MPSKYIHITFLLVIVTTTICYQTSQTLPQSIPSYKDRPIGCFYSDSICSSVEICFDDHAFGRCERIDVNGQVENDFTYQLDAKTFQLLRKELLRLSSQGYDWPDDYSQCILKTILNDRPRIVYDPSVCDHFMANDHSSNEVSAIRSLFTESVRSSDDHKSAPNRHLSWIFSSEKPVPRQQTKIENDPFNDDSQLVSYLRQIIDEHDDNNNRADTLSRLFVSDDDLPQAASLVRVPEIRVSRDITSNNDDDGDDSNFELKVLPLNEDLMIVDLDNEHQKQDSGEDVDEESSAQALDDLTDFNSFDKFNFDRHQRDDIKKPGPIYVEEYWFRTDEQEHPGDNNQMHDMSRAATKIQSSPTKKGFSSRASQPIAEGPVKMEKQSKSQENMLIIRSLEQGEHSNLEAIDSTHTYVVTDKILGEEDSGRFLQTIEQLFNLPRGTFSNLRKENHRITFKVNPNYLELNASQVAARIENMTQLIQNATGYSISETGIGDRINLPIHSPIAIAENNRHIKFLVILTCSLVVSVLMVAYLFYLLRDSLFRERIKRLMKLSEEWIHFDYQDLCRQRFGKNKADVEQGKQNKEDTKTADNQPTANETTAPHSPGSRSSTSSWVEEPVSSNMDITTGHIILTYMEEHLKNKLLLDEEWQALCAYEADPCSTNAALQKKNLHKNRYPDILPYDHSRVILNDSANVSNSDYINANTISDHDPRNPAYIATQGPLPNTNADFWQMIWEQGSVLIVMLTRLRENGLNMCDRYWPEEGSQLYGNDYEVHLVSEHIWCDDYLVRSFYLKNLKTGQTRTVTQFHYLSWPENGVPATIKSLLDFRRKVNKSYKGRSCPIVVHCSDGVARTGTYILIDMVLNRMAKGAKEIDIAASLEHLRDQRMGMVRTKAQFEFVLLAVADEVQAILKALSNNQ